MMWGTGFGSGGATMMIGAIVATAIVIAVLITGALWLVRTQRTGPIAEPSSSAAAILDARYARGEISANELMQHRQVLTEDSAGAGAKTNQMEAR